MNYKTPIFDTYPVAYNHDEPHHINMDMGDVTILGNDSVHVGDIQYLLKKIHAMEKQIHTLTKIVKSLVRDKPQQSPTFNTHAKITKKLSDIYKTGTNNNHITQSLTQIQRDIHCRKWRWVTVILRILQQNDGMTVRNIILEIQKSLPGFDKFVNVDGFIKTYLMALMNSGVVKMELVNGIEYYFKLNK